MLQEIKNELDREFNIRIHDNNEDSFTADCRNWGQWEFPQDESCDDGEDEDCDYEELTSESYSKLRIIMNLMKQRYTEYNFDYCTGEKNYIDFSITRKV